MPDTGSAPNKTFSRTDGTRTGTEVWQEAKAAPVKIRADDHDTHDQDIADAISNRLMRDGGNQPSADIPWNDKRITGLGAPTARTDAMRLDKVQDGAVVYGGTAGGTGDALTVTLSPAITAYAAGMLIALKASAANTGAATVNANSVGAKTIKKGLAGGSDLEASDIKSGRMALLAYDGTNMQMLNAPEFPSGTKMLFQQTAAPTGWTKDTSNNDNSAIRIVTGTPSTGGSVNFTTAFASQTPAGTVGDTTLTVNQIPLHGHPYRQSTSGDDGTTGGGSTNSDTNVTNYSAFTGTPSNTAGQMIGGTGGGQSHTHTFTGNAINLAVKYVDVIQATKD